MPSLTALPPRLLARARADQIATLFTQWPLTTASMLLGALILTVVMWGTASPRLFAAWMGAIQRWAITSSIQPGRGVRAERPRRVAAECGRLVETAGPSGATVASGLVVNLLTNFAVESAPA